MPSLFTVSGSHHLENLAAFVDKTQETVTGEVMLKLYKGNIRGHNLSLLTL